MFKKGYSFELAKKYNEALVEYHQAVKLTNTALVGRIAKQMGNCYYYLGVTQNAVTSYDYYLKYFPNDVPTRQLVDRLKGASSVRPATTPLATAEARKRTHPMSAMWRSMLIPGWGQWKRGDGWSGLAYFSGTALSAASVVYFNDAGNQAYEDYRKATTPATATAFSAQAKSMDGYYNISLELLATFYTVNVLDALFVTMIKNPPRPTKLAEMPTTSLALYPQADGMALRWTSRF